MKRLLLTLSIVSLLIACENEDMSKQEQNPYPDGIYPFEVTGVSHTRDQRNLSITWTNPTDSGFKNVQIEIFGFAGNVNRDEFLIYSSATGKGSDITNAFRNGLLRENSFSCVDRIYGDKFIIIKCVDKFGNVSSGVKYEFQWEDEE